VIRNRSVIAIGAAFVIGASSCGFYQRGIPPTTISRNPSPLPITQTSVTQSTETPTHTLNPPTNQVVEVTPSPSSTNSPQPTQILTSSPRPTKTEMSDPCTNRSGTDPGSYVVAFTAERDANKDIYTIRGDGSELTQITHNEMDDILPSWSPDGNMFAYISGNPFDGYRLVTMVSDGVLKTTIVPETITIGQLILDNPATSINVTLWDPLTRPQIQWYTWSPDSQKIVFSGEEGGLIGFNYIYLIQADGSSLVKLVGVAYGSEALSWSPDDQSIVFDDAVDTKGIFRRVNTIDENGNNLQTLYPLETVDTIRDFRAQWDPQNQLIIFTSSSLQTYQPSPLYSIKPDGSDRKEIGNENANKMWAYWSPDGRRIAYSTETVNSEMEATNRSIVIMNRDGSGEKIVARGLGLGVQAFSWSYDSRYLAFIRENNSIYDLYIADTCTNKTSLLAKDVIDLMPAWKP
jgi:Tol biopolymer transport system component